jgi:hypothetical protein
MVSHNFHAIQAGVDEERDIALEIFGCAGRIGTVAVVEVPICLQLMSVRVVHGRLQVWVLGFVEAWRTVIVVKASGAPAVGCLLVNVITKPLLTSRQQYQASCGG